MKNIGGRPFLWPWLTTPVGRAFILKAANSRSASQAASRVKRLHGVEYKFKAMAASRSFKMTRVK